MEAEKLALFADVERVAAPQDPSKPFYVKYSEQYDALMSIFRGLMDAGEKSQRALEVVTVLNKKIPSNPTAWWYREQIIKEIGYDITTEIEFVNSRLMKQPKPYQLWNHRQWLMENTEEPPDETEFFGEILDVDEKNFHAWSYFCWFADHFKKWDWLFEQTKNRVCHDPENNSAWSARFRALQNGNLDAKEDLEFALNMLRLWPRSESTCNYIRGLLSVLQWSEEAVAQVTEALQWLVDHSKANKHVYALLAHLAMKQGQAEKYDELIEKMKKIDIGRAHFWELMKSDSDRFEKVN